jgi:hypothetical protein
MSTEGFVDGLCEVVPTARSLVDEHVKDYDGDVLLHFLVGDVLSFAVASFERGDEPVTTPLLDYVDLALRTGEDPLQDAIAMSFVEDTRWWDPAMHAFIATWPPALTAEVRSQKSCRRRQIIRNATRPDLWATLRRRRSYVKA